MAKPEPIIKPYPANNTPIVPQMMHAIDMCHDSLDGTCMIFSLGPAVVTYERINHISSIGRCVL